MRLSLFFLLAWLTLTATAQRRPSDLILITLDTVRADRLGAYGYKSASTPHLDRLAAEGVRFDDATVHAPLTAPSHASLLTGMYPHRVGVRDNGAAPLPDGVTTIAEVLRSGGYRTGAFIGSFVLDRAYGFAQGFETFDADFGRYDSGLQQQAQRRAGDVVDAAVAWLERIPASERVLLWVHLYDAHTPYTPPAQYRARFAKSPYDGEIAYVDTSVGRLLDTLRRTGRYDQSVVTAIADHGESLGEHGEAEHGFFVYDAVLRVPWILRAPGVAPRVVREQTRAVDLVPTVLELLNVRVPAGFDGESLVGVVSGTPRQAVPVSYAESLFPRLHFGWSELRAVRDGEWKFIEAPRPELYALKTDPRERQNVAVERERLARGLRAEVARFQKQERDAPSAQPDAETLERLRSLGYVGLTSTAPGARGDDPKDRVDDFQSFRRLTSTAIDHLRARRPQVAIAALKKAIAIHPRAFDLHLFLGDAYQQAGEIESALGEYAAAAVLYPGVAAPHLASARALVAARRPDEALNRLDEAARIEPGSHEVPLVRGLAYRAKGDLARAQGEFARSVELNGRDPRARAQLADVSLRNADLATAKREFEALKAVQYQPARTELGLGRVAEMEG
ncbi:MAG TPA: sulfatase-like hydrolase/transferase, partial [Vicinamibacterales bacterium]|nr:sulfatase-like hydrolase/transferase [Vicinamibacterales bacterium]